MLSERDVPNMRFFSSLVRPDESTGAVMRWVHRIWVFFWLTVLGAGIGLLSLYLTAHSYASIDATALLQSYFKIPLLVAMNLLAPILLVYLGFFLFARPWAAYLLSALPFFTLALASYYKVQLRGDPCSPPTCGSSARRAASWATTHSKFPRP